MTATKKLSGKAQARVAIAKDVLKHLRSLKVGTGYYFNGPIFKGGAKGDDTQKHLKKLVKCEVCALGACLISHVRLFDEVPLTKVADFGRYDEYYDKEAGKGSFEFKSDRPVHILKKYFSRHQLNMIEAAFEQNNPFGGDLEELSKAIEFTEGIYEPKDRLKAIMKNIVENDGTFVPTPGVPDNYV